MREIRVLQFVNILDRGGTESFIFNNLEKMDHSKVNFDFLLTRDMEEPREADLVKYECQKITIVPNGNNKIERYVDLYKKLMNFFKKCDYKIIHFESNPPGIMSTASTLAARRAGIPVRILHSHGGGGEKVSFSRIRPIITRICRYINVKSCNYYMAPSNSSAVYGFGRKVSRSKRCVIIKNAIDVQKFLFDSNRREFYRRLLNIDNDTVILGTVGRISEVKNQEFMIDIFYEYVKYNTNARLILIGGAVETEKSIDEKLKKKVHSLGLEDKVVFFGECTDVPGIL